MTEQPQINGTSAVAPQVIPFKSPPPPDNDYVRDYVRRALAGMKIETPDPAKANGSREALLSLHTVAKAGGNVREAWERCVINVPELEIYTPAPPRWNVYSAKDLQTLPPLEFLVPGMIVAEGFNVMFGYSGTGKSFISLGIAYNLSQSTSILYVAAEGASGYRLRLDALEQRYKQEKGVDQPTGNIHFVPSTVNLMDRRETEQFVNEVVNVYKPRLVIFDTLARCMVGGDENSSRDMGILVDNCGLIQRTGAAVLMIHHTGKNGTGERGSSALRGAADSMIEVSKDDDLITVESSKLKDGIAFPTYYVKLLPFGESVAAVKTDKIKQTKDAKLTSSEHKILSVLVLEPFGESGCRASVLQSQVPLASSTFYKVLDKLMRKGFVRKINPTRQDPYFITPEGWDALRGYING